MEQQVEAELGRGIASVLQRQGRNERRNSIPAPTPPRLQVILMLSLQRERMFYACWRCDISAQRQPEGSLVPNKPQASGTLVRRREGRSAQPLYVFLVNFAIDVLGRHCRRHSDSFFLTKILKQINLECTVCVFRLRISWASRQHLSSLLHQQMLIKRTLPSTACLDAEGRTYQANQH